MNVKTDKAFDRNFKKRILPNRKLLTQFNTRLKLFVEDANHPLLRNHQLKGTQKNHFAFSVTGDIRVIYIQITEVDVVFVDIGSHNQVY